MARWTSTAALGRFAAPSARAGTKRERVAIRRPALTIDGLRFSSCPQCDDDAPGPPVKLVLRARGALSALLWLAAAGGAAYLGFETPLAYWQARLDHITATQYAGLGPAESPRFVGVVVLIVVLVPLVELCGALLARTAARRVALSITLCEACEKAHRAGLRARLVVARLAVSGVVLAAAGLSSWIYAVEEREWPRLVAETIEIVSVPCVVGFFLVVLAIVLKVRSAFHTDAAVIAVGALDGEKVTLWARPSFAARVRAERPDVVAKT